MQQVAGEKCSTPCLCNPLADHRQGVALTLLDLDWLDCLFDWLICCVALALARWGALSCVLQPETLAVGFEDVAAVRESVQCRAGQPL